MKSIYIVTWSNQFQEINFAIDKRSVGAKVDRV